MRQYRFSYDESFKKGLVSELGQRGFVRLQNLIPWEGGLRFKKRNATSEVSDSSYQCFRIGVEQIRVSGFKVERLVGDTFVDAAVLNMYPSSSWSCLDFIKFGIITDGNVSILFEDGDLSQVSLSEDKLPRANSACSLDSQAIVGGITNNWNSLDQEYIAWSKINGLDFTLDVSNEAGFYNPGIGKVYSVQPLGRSFVSLGEFGVNLSIPHQQTFGHKKISSIGIKSKQAAVSNKEEVFFIDRRGVLWIISGEGKATELGFSWIFADKDVKLTWSDAEQELRIVVDNQKTYCLNRFGLYETDLVILGEAKKSDGSVLYTTYGGYSQSEALFELNQENANVSGFKTVSEVYIDQIDNTEDNRYIYITSIIGNREYRSKDFKLNMMNLSQPNISVDNYRIGYRILNYTEADNRRINGLSIQTVKTDGRFGKGYSPSQIANGG